MIEGGSSLHDMLKTGLRTRKVKVRGTSKEVRPGCVATYLSLAWH